MNTFFVQIKNKSIKAFLLNFSENQAALITATIIVVKSVFERNKNIGATMKHTTILMIIIVALTGWSSSAVAKYYGKELCAYPGFSCVKVKSGDTWAKLFPRKRDREIVQRLNRTNMALRHRTWIVVPTDINAITNMDLTPFPTQRDTGGKKLIIVDLGLKAFGAYDQNGQLVHWGPVSGGQGWCPDIQRSCHSATGSYRIFRKQGVDCESSKFPVDTDGGAPMPYCMHYYRGFALHGSELPGYNASHGCIRLFYDDAKWLNKYFTEIGTKVIVRDGNQDDESEGVTARTQDEESYSY